MIDFLYKILNVKSSNQSIKWLKEKQIELDGEGFKQREFCYAFSGVSRYFRKDFNSKNNGDLIFQENETSDELLKRILRWDALRISRVILILTLSKVSKSIFLKLIKLLIETSDIREQVAIFSSFEFIPYLDELSEFAVDGIRTNIIDVFDSISSYNNFPKKNFNSSQWNQMIIKAIFLDRPLYKILGIEDKKNADLSVMISDLYHERRSALRWLNPEIWRSTIGFLNNDLINDLNDIIETKDQDFYRESVALLLNSSNYNNIILSNLNYKEKLTCENKLNNLRRELSLELAKIKEGKTTWESLGKEIEFKKFKIK